MIEIIKLKISSLNNFGINKKETPINMNKVSPLARYYSTREDNDGLMTVYIVYARMHVRRAMSMSMSVCPRGTCMPVRVCMHRYVCY